MHPAWASNTTTLGLHASGKPDGSASSRSNARRLSIGRENSCSLLQPSSEERGAAIDVDGLPGDGARLARTKKESRARDFVGRLPAALQNHVQKSGELFFGADA